MNSYIQIRNLYLANNSTKRLQYSSYAQYKLLIYQQSNKRLTWRKSPVGHIWPVYFKLNLFHEESNNTVQKNYWKMKEELNIYQCAVIFSQIPYKKHDGALKFTNKHQHTLGQRTPSLWKYSADIAYAIATRPPRIRGHIWYFGPIGSIFIVCKRIGSNRPMKIVGSYMTPWALQG